MLRTGFILAIILVQWPPSRMGHVITTGLWVDLDLDPSHQYPNIWNMQGFQAVGGIGHLF